MIHAHTYEPPPPALQPAEMAPATMLPPSLWDPYVAFPYLPASALSALADAVQTQEEVPIPPRAMLLPLVKALREEKSTHAAVVLRAIARHHPHLIARAGALPALLRATTDADAPKLRGWALSAIALMARSTDAHTSSLLLEALPTLVEAAARAVRVVRTRSPSS